jgi:3-oxoacyl-[acyl-carrier protein] reductase
VLENTIGPTDGAFENLDDAGWQAAFDLGAMSAVRTVRQALPMLRARVIGTDRHPLGALYPASESGTDRLHRVESGAIEPDKEFGQNPGTRTHSGERRLPGTIVTASFIENLNETSAAYGLKCHRST